MDEGERVYTIVFTELADKQFSKLNDEMKERIFAVLERIRLKPESYVTKLVNESGFKLRIGDYRAILDIQSSNLIILVIKIGHRKNVYD